METNVLACGNRRGGMQLWAAQPLTRVLQTTRRSNPQLVEAHGGSISVASRRGKGSVFTFTLRVRAALGWARAGLSWVLCTCRAVSCNVLQWLPLNPADSCRLHLHRRHPCRCMHMRMEAPQAQSPHSSGARWRWRHRRRPMQRRRNWTRCGETSQLLCALCVPQREVLRVCLQW